ncbi:MAG: efflux RND transporter periplasmic adaptor subunit [Deltaproteobacteria bacterium]|nr:efflux RND transporter periplasmic adaptor subunit [Deltaproteobacteria bacterium]
MAWKGIAGVLGAAAFVAAGVWVGRATARPPEASGEKKPGTPVPVRGADDQEVLATGAVRSQVGAEVRVGARISGRVDKLLVKVGDVVTAGQVIAEIEHADLDARIKSAQADLDVAHASLALLQRGPRSEDVDAARAGVREAQAEVEMAKLTVDRRHSLVERGMATAEQLDDAERALAVARARAEAARQTVELRRTPYLPEELDLAAARIGQAEAALELAGIQLSYATIRSPIAGIVASVSTQEGETVSSGMSAPTFVTVIDLSRLQVEAYVDEVDIGRVRPGLAATFTVDAYPDREFPGTVAAIYPKAVLQDNVVNYLTIVTVDDPGGLLRPEMTANVTVKLPEQPDDADAPVGEPRSGPREAGDASAPAPSGGPDA